MISSRDKSGLHVHVNALLTPLICYLLSNNSSERWIIDRSANNQCKLYLEFLSECKMPYSTPSWGEWSSTYLVAVVDIRKYIFFTSETAEPFTDPPSSTKLPTDRRKDHLEGDQIFGTKGLIWRRRSVFCASTVTTRQAFEQIDVVVKTWDFGKSDPHFAFHSVPTEVPTNLLNST